MLGLLFSPTLQIRFIFKKRSILVVEIVGCVVEVLAVLGLVSGCVLSCNPWYVEGYDDP